MAGVRGRAAVVAQADLVIDRVAEAVLAALHAGWPRAWAPYHIILGQYGYGEERKEIGLRHRARNVKCQDLNSLANQSVNDRTSVNESTFGIEREEGRVLRSENKKNSITMSCVDGRKIFKMSHCSIASIELRTVFQKLRRLPTFPNKERSVGPSSGYWSSRTLRIPTAPWLIFRE